MKKFVFYLLFAIAGTALAHTAGAVVKFAGHIEHPAGDSVTFTYNLSYLSYLPKTFTARLDAEGNFAVSFPLTVKGYTSVELVHGNKLAELLVKDGDSLHVRVDAASFDSTIAWAGRGSLVQNFLATHSFRFGRMNQYSLAARAFFDTEPEQFLHKLDSLKSTQLNFAKGYPQLPKDFVRYWQVYHVYYNYFFMQQYPIRNADKDLTAYKVIKQMPRKFNDSFLNIPPYLLYLIGEPEAELKQGGMATYNYLTEMLAKDSTIAKIHAKDPASREYYQAQRKLLLDTTTKLANHTMPAGSREYYIAQGIYARTRSQSIDLTKEQIRNFTEQWPNSEHLPVMLKQFEIADRLAPGHLAPDFDIVTSDGTTMKLSDLKGKVVFLSFWAGWCKQCVGEMANERKLKDFFLKKQMEFVHVSIGEDTAMEQKIISHYKLEGIFTTAKGGWYSKETAMYGVQRIPAYYIIDTEGKFVTQDVPPFSRFNELATIIAQAFR